MTAIDRKALNKIPEEERKEKEVQLRVTAEKAEKDLVENLEKAARKNLWKEPPGNACHDNCLVLKVYPTEAVYQ